MELKLISLFLTLAVLSSANAAELSCNFQDMFDAQFPACYSFNITPVTSANEEIIILRQPSDYVDIRTTYLNFNQDSVINFIPSQIFKYFPALTQFAAINASVTTFVTDAFIDCENLTYISINENNIPHVPARIASTCYAVEMLYLMQNNIQTIHEDAFEGMEGLFNLGLMGNQITCIPPMLFQHTKGLSWIDITTNKINALHPHIFKDLTQLNQINLMMNNIEYIPNFELSHTGTVGMMGSVYLYLNENPINAIDPQFLTSYFYSRSFYGHQSLSLNFYTSNPNISTCIDINAHPNNQMLQYLQTYNWVQYNTSMAHRTNCYSNWNEEMARNSLVTCGTVIKPTTTTASPVTSTTSSSGSPTNAVCRFYLDWKNRYSCVISGVELKLTSISGTHLDGYENVHVTRVYFIKSELSKVPGILFDTFENLDFLSITNCGLSLINDHTFNKCGKLQYLDASYNDIVHVEETSLRNCTSLKTIDLTGNPVELLDSEIYKFDPALEKVHLNRVDGLELA